MKKLIIGAVIVLVVIGGLVIWYFNTATGQRMIKSIQSNNSGGIERVVKVYSDDGKLIEEYEGKIDIQDTEYGNKILFDLNGKRVVIYNGTVVTGEK
ncbi:MULTISPECIES: hypothetical protein [Bacillus]|uniref:Uncharacterized protein n=2 Tax=Bacillus TaxID=1386 RepID=A0A0M4G9W6_9BACI|nr:MULTISPECIES: hypothetical protein [Bacillus]ALC82240.1 hypothetical protein AM592_12125 [Bacillus gobiensis]MBP1081092.1 hypothetical protein [Bacillus capparidis]MED1095780.1 hypothetical protein [Bacillus capparidis]